MNERRKKLIKNLIIAFICIAGLTLVIATGSYLIVMIEDTGSAGMITIVKTLVAAAVTCCIGLTVYVIWTRNKIRNSRMWDDPDQTDAMNGTDSDRQSLADIAEADCADDIPDARLPEYLAKQDASGWLPESDPIRERCEMIAAGLLGIIVLVIIAFATYTLVGPVAAVALTGATLLIGITYVTRIRNKHD